MIGRNGVVAPYGGAAALDPAVRLAGEPRAELGQQARLADAGLAGDEARPGRVRRAARAKASASRSSSRSRPTNRVAPARPPAPDLPRLPAHDRVGGHPIGLGRAELHAPRLQLAAALDAARRLRRRAAPRRAPAWPSRRSGSAKVSPSGKQRGGRIGRARRRRAPRRRERRRAAPAPRAGAGRRRAGSPAPPARRAAASARARAGTPNTAVSRDGERWRKTPPKPSTRSAIARSQRLASVHGSEPLRVGARGRRARAPARRPASAPMPRGDGRRGSSDRRATAAGRRADPSTPARRDASAVDVDGRCRGGASDSAARCGRCRAGARRGRRCRRRARARAGCCGRRPPSGARRQRGTRVPEQRARSGRCRRALPAPRCVDLVGGAEQRDALHQMAELAHVARPRIGGEPGARRVASSRFGDQAVRVGVRAQKVLGEQRRRRRARSRSGGMREHQHGEPVVEVGAEAAPAATSACRSRCVAAISLTSTSRGATAPSRRTRFSSIAFSTLLCTGGDSESISSRKSVPPEAASNRPGFAALRVGERAGLEAEQLGLEHGLRDGGAVDVDERARRRAARCRA